MPTFTTVALDSIIEPKFSKLAAAEKSKSEPKLERKNNNSTLTRHGSGFLGADGKRDLRRNNTISFERKNHWTQISPALYATPEPTPLPDSPVSFLTSPYVVDHKRRGPRLAKSFSEDEAVFHQAVANEKTVELGKSVLGKSVEAEDIGSTNVFNITNDVSGDVLGKHVKFLPNIDVGKAEGVGSSKVLDTTNTVSGDVKDNHVKLLHNAHGKVNTKKIDMLDREGEVDDFFDPHDTMSAKSSNDGESNHGLERTVTSNTPFAEFFDAWEELASETGIQHTATDVEGELRELRMGFLVEMEKRRQAESHLNDMKSQWGRIREQLSIVGLTLPTDPTMQEDEPATDPGEEVCRQVDLLRFVSNSVGRGVAKAELEEEMGTQLHSKNFEITRLLDKLRYYEAVNHEMSQRNQESVEHMRRVRQRRKRRQRWIWGSIAVAITLGSSALAWSYGKGPSSSTNPTPTSKSNQ